MRTQQLARLTFLSLCLLPVLATAQQQKQQQPQSDTAKILALEAKWTEAHKLRQIDILSTLLAKTAQAGCPLPWHGRGRRFDPDQVHHFLYFLTRQQPIYAQSPKTKDPQPQP